MEYLEQFVAGDIIDDKEDFNGGNHMSAATTVMGIVTGMIGINCLVMPTVGLTAGYIDIVWTCALMGYICYYTAVLIVTHMGKSKNIKECVLAHFKGDYKYMAGYSVINWLAFLPALFGIFRILCLQIQGLIGYKSIWVGPIVAVALIAGIIVIRITHFAEESMALGLLSIGLVILFLLWAFVTAPSGPNSVPATGNAFNMAAVFIVSFAIHDYITQCLFKNPNKSEYKGIIRISFLSGFFINLLATLGCFAIVNRPTNVAKPQVISDYFHPGQWQLVIIQLVYLITAVTTLPSFLIVSKIRFFQIFKIDLKANIALHEVIYILVTVLMCLTFYMSRVNLQVLYALNGALLGYSNVIIIPIWVHLKCLWWDRSSGKIEGDEEWNSKMTTNACSCDNQYKSRGRVYVETAFLLMVMVGGAVMMVVTLVELGEGFTGSQTKLQSSI